MRRIVSDGAGSAVQMDVHAVSISNGDNEIGDRVEVSRDAPLNRKGECRLGVEVEMAVWVVTCSQQIYRTACTLATL